MANLSFTSSGATPFNVPLNGGGTQTSSPGVNNKPTFSYAGRYDGLPGVTASPTPYSAALNQAKTPAPSTPIKSTTVTHPDGTSIATTYHPEATANASKTASSTPTSTSANGGYSTVEGPYDPVTGMLKSTQSGNGTLAEIKPTEKQTTGESTPTTFPGLIGGLAQTSQNGSTAGQNYTQQTADYGAGNIPIGQSAKDIAADYGKQIADVGSKGAQFRAGQLTTGTSPVAQGNAAVTAQTTAAQQQALATGEEAALQGTGQQLTAQGQAANATNAAAGQANTAQANKQSGLTNAGTLAQPSATAQGQTTFDPLTGKFSGGSYQQNVQDVANAIKSGNIGYTDGVNSLAGLSPTAKADVLAALGTGFDTVASDANATARGSNIQTGGTAVTGANAQGLQGAIQEQANLQAQTSAAKTLADQLAEAVKSSGLNITNSTDANATISNLQSRLGNDAYTKLNIAVNDARNAYAAILSSTGATPTDAGNAADQNINGKMSIKQILGAIDQLNSGLYARQKAADEKVQQYNSQLNSTSSTNPSRQASSGGTTVQTSAGAVNTNW